MNGPQVLEVVLLGQDEDDRVVAVATAGMDLEQEENAHALVSDPELFSLRLFSHSLGFCVSRFFGSLAAFFRFFRFFFSLLNVLLIQQVAPSSLKGAKKVCPSEFLPLPSINENSGTSAVSDFKLPK